jgi:glycosyltransferase involved in cell wall biosynthesis
MKIVFVSNLYAPNVVGGAELTLQTLAEEMLRVGLGVSVVTLAIDGTDRVDNVGGVPVHRVAVPDLHGPFGPVRSTLQKLLWHWRDRYDLEVAEKVGRILSVAAPDVVSTHNLTGFTSAVWDVARAHGLRVVHTLHDYHLLCPRSTMFRNGRNCIRQCVPCAVLSRRKLRASGAVNAVIGVSRFVLDAHRGRGYFKHAVAEVIYNARAWDEPAAADASGGARGAGSGAAGALRLGYIGRIEAAKGIEVLLRAVSRLPSGAWTLRIAGRAPQPEYLAQLRARFPLAAIEFVGFMRPRDFYPTIDVLVLPSLWNEPFGVVAYEAMGFGRPVIGSRRGGIPEIIEGSGAGWLFDPDDPDELTQLLARIIAAPEQIPAMRAACFERRRRFLPERQLAAFLKIAAYAVSSSAQQLQ